MNNIKINGYRELKYGELILSNDIMGPSLLKVIDQYPWIIKDKLKSGIDFNLSSFYRKIINNKDRRESKVANWVKA